MAISLRSTSSTQAPTSTFTVTAPSGMTAGDVLVAIESTHSSNSGNPGTPTGWTFLTSIAYTTAPYNVLTAFWKLATSGDVSTGSWTFNGLGGLNQNALVYVYAWENALATGPDQYATGGSVANLTAAQTGSLTPGQNGEGLVAGIGWSNTIITDSSQAFSDGTSVVADLGTITESSTNALDSFYGIQTAAGAVHGAATLSGSGATWGGIIVSVPPAAPSYDPSASNAWAGSEVVRRFGQPFRASCVADEGQTLLSNAPPAPYDPSQGTFNSYGTPIRVTPRWTPSPFDGAPPAIPSQAPPVPLAPDSSPAIAYRPRPFRAAPSPDPPMPPVEPVYVLDQPAIARFIRPRDRAAQVQEVIPPAQADPPTYPAVAALQLSIRRAAPPRPAADAPTVFLVQLDTHAIPLDVQPSVRTAPPRSLRVETGSTPIALTPVDALLPLQEPASPRRSPPRLATGSDQPYITPPTAEIISISLWSGTVSLRQLGAYFRFSPGEAYMDRMDTAPPWVDLASPVSRQMVSRRPTPPADSLAVSSPYLDDDASVSAPLSQALSFRREGARPRPFAGDVVILDIVGPVPVWIGALADDALTGRRVLSPRARTEDTPLAEFVTAPIWTGEMQSSAPYRAPVRTPRIAFADDTSALGPVSTLPPTPASDAQLPTLRRSLAFRPVVMPDDSPLFAAAVVIATDHLGQGWHQQTVQPRRPGPWRAAPGGEYPPGIVDTLTSTLTVETWGQPVADRQRQGQRVFAPNAADVLIPMLVGQTYAVDAPFTVRFSPRWQPFDVTAHSEPDWLGVGVVIVAGPYWIPACGIFWAGAVEGDTQED